MTLEPHPIHGIVTYFLCVFGTILAALPFQQVLLTIVCARIDPTLDYETCAKSSQVQRNMASWSLWFANGTDIPALFAMILAGYFVDRIGRKAALLVSATAMTLKAIAYILAASGAASLEVLFFVSVVTGVMGGTSLMDVACSGYISATTDSDNRTKYFMLQSFSIQVVMMSAPLLGGIIGEKIGFISVFASMLIMSVILLGYLFFVFPDVALVESDSAPKSIRSVFSDSVTSTFNTIHLLFSYKASFGLLALMTLFAISASGSEAMFLLYPALKFGWQSIDVGAFASFISVIRIGLLTLALPVIQTFLSSGHTKNKTKGEIILMQSSLLMAVTGEICLGLSETATQFWMASVPVSFSVFAVPSAKALVSTLLPANYQGRLFSSISLFQTVTGIVSIVVINGIYRATVEKVPNTVFFVMAGLYFTGFLISLIFVRSRTVDAMRAACGSVDSEEVQPTEETPLLA
ncbi:hypothetical protein HDU79_004179 [Rhizoclosmatium sp. JEL0117]|nr:hypothetical protein HDU79_004179 [Rhizoclosmatium sp. JEL0117]